MAKLDKMLDNFVNKSHNIFDELFGSANDFGKYAEAANSEGIKSISAKRPADDTEEMTVKFTDLDNNKRKMTYTEFRDAYPKSASILDTIKTAVNVDDDNLIEAIRSLTEPSTGREGMQELYDNLLGYDPTTYFDEHEIAARVKEFQENNKDLLDDDTADTIIDRAITLFEENRDFNQSQAIKSAMLDCEDIPSSTVQEFEDHYVTPFITEDENDSSLILEDDEDEEELGGLEDDEDDFGGDDDDDI